MVRVRVGGRGGRACLVPAAKCLQGPASSSFSKMQAQLHQHDLKVASIGNTSTLSVVKSGATVWEGAIEGPRHIWVS